MRLTSLVLAAGLATVTVLGSGTAAHAERASIKDKRADVVRTTYSADEYEMVEQRQLNTTSSKKSGIDAKSVRFDHDRRTISVTVRFSRLKSGSGMYVGIYAPGSKEPDFQAYGEVGESKSFVYGTEDYEDACSGDFASRRGRNGWMTLTIERSCLGDLPEIRMSVGASRLIQQDGALVTYRDALSVKKIRTPQKTRLLAAG
ncbi:hypothetical protein [Aeromicrobium sp. IC_218]|uniref:hypothetical protein n=1 Tax=Aeromicrobium sp. IC_218 TaxID=2545468 RepID=UPI00103FA0A4|nr:hypothetical protein [Aeromicrobium sp. IC_218]TCI99464.1 hypothetical protein E0W78_06940 [Aeromicrobium sp. IC_218]